MTNASLGPQTSIPMSKHISQSSTLANDDPRCFRCFSPTETHLTTPAPGTSRLLWCQYRNWFWAGHTCGHRSWQTCQTLSKSSHEPVHMAIKAKISSLSQYPTDNFLIIIKSFLNIVLPTLICEVKHSLPTLSFLVPSLLVPITFWCHPVPYQ